MKRKKKFKTKYSAEFKISVILDMRENHLSNILGFTSFKSNPLILETDLIYVNSLFIIIDNYLFQ